MWLLVVMEQLELVLELKDVDARLNQAGCVLIETVVLVECIMIPYKLESTDHIMKESEQESCRQWAAVVMDEQHNCRVI